MLFGFPLTVRPTGTIYIYRYIHNNYPQAHRQKPIKYNPSDQCISIDYTFTQFTIYLRKWSVSVEFIPFRNCAFTHERRRDTRENECARKRVKSAIQRLSEGLLLLILLFCIFTFAHAIRITMAFTNLQKQPSERARTILSQEREEEHESDYLQCNATY